MLHRNVDENILKYEVSSIFELRKLSILLILKKLTQTIKNIHFEILGVNRDSTNAEIKKAYILQIKKWHPDKYSNQPEKQVEALEKSKCINLAYELLENYIPPHLEKEQNTIVIKQTRFNDDKQRSNKRYVEIKRRNARFANVVSAGYDLKSSVLQVQLKNGSIMQFYNVPPEVFNDLMFSFNRNKFYTVNIYNRFKKEIVK